MAQLSKTGFPNALKGGLEYVVSGKRCVAPIAMDWLIGWSNSVLQRSGNI